MHKRNTLHSPRLRCLMVVLVKTSGEAMECANRLTVFALMRVSIDSLYIAKHTLRWPLCSLPTRLGCAPEPDRATPESAIPSLAMQRRWSFPQLAEQGLPLPETILVSLGAHKGSTDPEAAAG